MTEEAGTESVATDEFSSIPISPKTFKYIEEEGEDDEDNYSQNFSEEMTKLLQRFSTNINETMQAKRKKIQKFTQVC